VLIRYFHNLNERIALKRHILRMDKNFIGWIAISVFLAFTTNGYAGWSQDRFIIMSWGDPLLLAARDSTEPIVPFNEAEAKKFVDANFNTLSGVIFCDDSCGIFKSGIYQNSILYNQRMMDSLAAWNNRTGNSVRAFQGTLDFKNDDKCSAGYIDSVIRVFGPSAPSERRSVLQGYYFGDEPSSNHEMENYRNVANSLYMQDSARPAYAGLLPIYGFSSNFTTKDLYATYEEYVDGSASHVGGVLAFDFYPFLASDGACVPFPPDAGGWQRNDFYSNFLIGAEKAKYYKKSFIPTLQADADLYNGGSHCWAYISPRLPDLNMEVGTALAYGAKGVAWYAYRTSTWATWLPDSIKSRYASIVYPDQLNSSVRNSITEVNRRLLAIGPTVMGLTYQYAAHGSDADPTSGEVLPRVVPDSCVSNKNDEKKYLLLGTLTDSLNDTVLVVSNKDRKGSHTFEFATSGKVRVERLSDTSAVYAEWPANYSLGKTHWVTEVLDSGAYSIYRIVPVSNDISVKPSQWKIINGFAELTNVDSGLSMVLYGYSVLASSLMDPNRIDLSKKTLAIVYEVLPPLSNPWWEGSLDVSINSPLNGIYNQYIGHAEIGNGINIPKIATFNLPVGDDEHRWAAHDFQFLLAANGPDGEKILIHSIELK